MDTNQLAEGIARAIEAAKPAQEYCLLWIDHWSMCMTKAEWSGWMQAIGSALALALAIGLPYIQKRKAELENYLMAKHCLMVQCALIEGILVQGKASNGDFRSAMSATVQPLENLLQLYREVRPSLLSSGAKMACMSGETTALQLRDFLSNVQMNNVREEGWQPSIETLFKCSVEQLKDFASAPKRSSRS
jgi:uncharacterized membrane protein